AGREDHTVQFGDLHGEPPTASERCGPVRLCAIAALQVVVELLIAAEVAPIDQVLLPPVQGPHLCVWHRGAEISPYTAKDSSRFGVSRHEYEHAVRAICAHLEHVDAVCTGGIRRVGGAELHITGWHLCRRREACGRHDTCQCSSQRTSQGRNFAGHHGLQCVG